MDDKALLVVLLLLKIMMPCLSCPDSKIKHRWIDNPGRFHDLRLVDVDEEHELRQYLGDNQSSCVVSKRWASIPVHSNVAEGKYYVGPWPREKPECGDKSIVYLCFEDERSLQTLYDYWIHAVMNWAPAFLYSSLDVAPDPNCGDAGWRCLCESPELIPDTLRISNPKGDLSSPHTAVGYHYNTDRLRRHHLTFPTDNHLELNPSFVSGDDSTIDRYLKYVMIHELGHTFGLLHEHQRSDRDEYVAVMCRRFEGYEEAEKTLNKMDDPAFAPLGQDARARMQLVCKDATLAAKYLPAASDNTESGYGVFDFASIMIYDSIDHTPPILLRQDDYVKDGTDDDDFVYSSGSHEFDKRSISAEDIKRIAQLYPGDATQQAAAAALKSWGAAAVSKEGVFKGTIYAAPVDIVTPPSKSPGSPVSDPGSRPGTRKGDHQGIHAGSGDDDVDRTP